MKHPVVGYSLSMCVRDILDGHVAERDVERIIAGTRAVTESDWERVMASYRSLHWHHDPEGERIATRLMAAGRIDQPRLRDEPAPNISGGWWNNAS